MNKFKLHALCSSIDMGEHAAHMEQFRNVYSYSGETCGKDAFRECETQFGTG